MVEVRFAKKFVDIFSKIRDEFLKDKVKKQINIRQSRNRKTNEKHQKRDKRGLYQTLQIILFLYD